ncbi:MAG: Sec-independent protein translocase protein TatB [Candidatus Acinetobacter avistercoris]|uniref:Sec-independent protein translocase protein TatB n=1 Tax=Acinetobacter sp. KS-LM10 TaxID=3120518 RepID=UPI001F9420DE|nr:Sec-independent protein translocase protein TatB [Candidatus Acinetobacter avistercoris]
MLNIGMAELLMFGIIALLVLGPEKLPEGVRFAGKWYAKIKRMVSNAQNDLDRELRLSELREQMNNEMNKIQELEQKMKVQMSALENQRIEIADETKPNEAKSDNAKSDRLNSSELSNTSTPLIQAQRLKIYTYIEQPQPPFAFRINNSRINAQTKLNKMPLSSINHEMSQLKVAV